MQREQILEHALNVLEQNGLAATLSLETLAGETELTLDRLQQFWPDRDALLYDALRYHGQQIETWRRQILLDESLSSDQKLMARYEVLSEQVSKGRFPGCLFIAACSFYPQPDQPIHKLAEQQKRGSWQFTHDILVQQELDNPGMVADQMELILEGCLSRLLVKRNVQDVATAQRLAEDVYSIALCRKNGALA
ncbi:MULTISPECIES: transcriptional regulator [unclassified Pantoea]|uniref:division control transcriptional repressor DicD n=1 Tax=unclassified Pantoea TaxID=2630326 RepID=UPI0023DBA7B0|nr:MULTISPECIES: transcriptional regulator [unclassified Pantoea]MDF2043398.1 transcriptional regulator [Pantoea sp. Cr_R14]MDF2072451.1 transcriptional regulator [Pantoea sp. Cr_R13]MDF2080699.1 transcriptional regulator [Pantoea sp. Cr_R21]